jgi:D-glycero-alpha-D-manno-heptose-7-phosphate kinase
MEVSVEVPVRACDVGGWTDTWFAGHGRVCSLAVGPGVSVVVRPGARGAGVVLQLVDYGVEVQVGAEPAQHRLLAEAVREAGVAEDADLSVRISSAVPPGSALGTSAAVVVGVLAALDRVQGVRRTPADLAAAAHRVESVRLGRQSGVQDQTAAALGGANLIEIEPYPVVSATEIGLSDETRLALDGRLVHVAYGAPHDSSAVHEEVIGQLAAEGPSSSRLEVLRELAERASAGLRTGDLDAYGAVLTAATEAQRSLHVDLVSAEADALVEVARHHRALGWKVNGAGGPGGTLSVLCRRSTDAAAFRDAAAALGHRPLDLRLARQGSHAISR